jgi:hypothetical protein
MYGVLVALDRTTGSTMAGGRQIWGGRESLGPLTLDLEREGGPRVPHTSWRPIEVLLPIFFGSE